MTTTSMSRVHRILTLTARTAAAVLVTLLSAGALSANTDDLAPAGKATVNINQATAAEFARLPRVGDKLAERVVAHRYQNGPFKRVEDLMEVKGIGEKMFKSLKPYLTTTGTTTLAAKVSSSSKGSSGKSAKGSAKSGGKASAPAAAKGSKKAPAPAAPGR